MLLERLFYTYTQGRRDESLELLSEFQTVELSTQDYYDERSEDRRIAQYRRNDVYILLENQNHQITFQESCQM